VDEGLVKIEDERLLQMEGRLVWGAGDDGRGDGGRRVSLRCGGDGWVKQTSDHGVGEEAGAAGPAVDLQRVLELGIWLELGVEHATERHRFLAVAGTQREVECVFALLGFARCLVSGVADRAIGAGHGIDPLGLGRGAFI
jgi:hypothetical protein